MTTVFTVSRKHKTLGGSALSPEFATRRAANAWIDNNKARFASELETSGSEQDIRSGAEKVSDYEYAIDRRQWA